MAGLVVPADELQLTVPDPDRVRRPGGVAVRVVVDDPPRV
jgi:hypothetical protein